MEGDDGEWGKGFVGLIRVLGLGLGLGEIRVWKGEGFVCFGGGFGVGFECGCGGE